MYKLILLLLMGLLSACGTYYDPTDDYMRGLRWFDRKDFEIAKKHWEPLANAQDCDAEQAMGTLYFFGAGVPKNYQIAHKWWSTAANRGQANAQILLATMYAHDRFWFSTVVNTARYDCREGCGYEKDLVTAYQWMRLAERYIPDDEHRKILNKQSERFKQSLTVDQIVKADRYVQEWKPSPDQCKQRGNL